MANFAKQYGEPKLAKFESRGEIELHPIKFQEFRNNFLTALKKNKFKSINFSSTIKISKMTHTVEKSIFGQLIKRRKKIIKIIKSPPYIVTPIEGITLPELKGLRNFILSNIFCHLDILSALVKKI